MADPCTKFEVSSLTVAEILHGVGVKFYKWSPDSEHAPFRGDFFIGRVGLAMVNQCTKFDLSMRFTRYEARNGSAKCRKWGGLG